MIRRKSICVVFALVSFWLCAEGLTAQQRTWTATAGTSDWNDPTNWNPVGVPSATDPVIIPASAFPPSTVGGAQCGGITVQNGGRVDVDAAFPLQVAGNATVQSAGMIAGSGTVVFQGSAALTAWGGVVGGGPVFPNIAYVGTGSLTLNTCVIGGDLTASPGSGTVGFGTSSTIRIEGNAHFLGAGVVQGGSNPLGTELSVRGDIVMLPTSLQVVPPPSIRCGGNWTSDARFQGGTGMVTFTGESDVTPAIVGETPVSHWYGVTLSSGVTATIQQSWDVAGTLSINGDLTVLGSTFVLRRVYAGQSNLGVSPGAHLTLPAVTTLRSMSGVSVSGVLSAPQASMDIDGRLTVNATGQVDVAAGTHDLGGVDLSGALNGPTRLRLDGSPSTLTSTVPLPAIELVAGDLTLNRCTIAGDFTATPASGTVSFASSSTIRIEGDADFRGAAVLQSGSNPMGTTLDVRGDVTMLPSAQQVVPPPNIRCGGSWTSDARFQGGYSIVTFTGESNTTPTITGESPVARWYGVTIGSGVSTTIQQSWEVKSVLWVQGDLTVLGSTLVLSRVHPYEPNLSVSPGAHLTLPAVTTLRSMSGVSVSGFLSAPQASMDIDGKLAVYATGQVDVAAGTHDLGGVDLSGTLNGPTRLRLDGSPSTLTSTVPLPAIELVAGDLTLNRCTIAGDFTATPASGTVSFASSSTIRIEGDADFRGAAVLQSGSNPMGTTLDVRGDVTMLPSAQQVVPPPNIRCGGSWTSDARFQGGYGSVTFTGESNPTPTLVAEAPVSHWYSVTVSAGVLTTTPQSWEVRYQLAVHGGLTLGGSLALTTTNSSLNSLSVGPQGNLALPSATALSAVGTLSVSGRLNAPLATLDLDGGLTVNQGGQVDLATGTHTLWSVYLTGALNGPSRLRLDGSTCTVGSTTPLPAIDFVGGALTLGSCTIGGDLTQAPGAGAVSAYQFAAIRIEGNADFRGSSVTLSTTTQPVSIRGDIVMLPASPVLYMPIQLNCGGSWTSDAQFQPRSGQLVFTGESNPTPAITGESPTSHWFHVNIGAGVTATAAQSWEVGGHLGVSGDLTLQGPSLRLSAPSNYLSVTANGHLTLPTATILGSASTVNVWGTLDAPNAVLQAPANVTVFQGGALSLGAGSPPALVHQVAGLSVSGSLSFSGPTVMNFVTNPGNSSSTVTSTVPLPPIVFSAPPPSTLTLGNVVVGGDFAQTTGAGGVYVDGHAQILGQAQFDGLFLADYSRRGNLDVSSHLSLGTVQAVVDPPQTTACGGDLTVTGNNFVSPRNDWTMEFDGGTVQTVTANTVRFYRTIATGAGTDVRYQVQGLAIGSDLEIQANSVFQAPPTLLDVDGNCLIRANGELRVGAGTNTLSSGAVVDGRVTSTGVVTFDGVGTLSGTGVFEPGVTVRIASTGTIAVPSTATLDVQGDLEQISGTLQLTGATIHVGGTGRFLGGVVAGSGLLDLNGDAEFTGSAAGATLPRIECAGDWKANASFAPPAGHIVLLDGTGTTTLESPSGALSFGGLEISNGTRDVVGPLTVAARNRIVVNALPGSRLRVGPRQSVEIQGGPVAVSGVLDSGGGSRIRSNGTIEVPLGGLLRLAGEPREPAWFDGQGTAGIIVHGTIEAVNCVLHALAPTGMVIDEGATIGAAPFDLRNLTFESPPTAGSVLLNVSRSAGQTAVIVYARFEQSGFSPPPPYNVNTLGAGTIRFVNWSGSFAGPAFEWDPNNRIIWDPVVETELRSFRAVGGVGRVALRFETAKEIDAAAFVLSRRAVATAPWDVFARVPASGGPTQGASYTADDRGALDLVRYEYRLEEELTHGALRELHVDAGRSLPSGGRVGNSWFVSPQTDFTDIGAVIAAASAGQNIVIDGGTYAAFTLDKPLRILSTGIDPVRVDTSTGPVVLQPGPTPGETVLSGLEIGDLASPHGLEVRGAPNLVVLDSVRVSTAPGVVGVMLDGSPKVAMQGSTATGGAGILLRNRSVLDVARTDATALVLESSSRAVHAESTFGSITTRGGSTARGLARRVPWLESSRGWECDADVRYRVTGDANVLWVVDFGFGNSFVEFPAVLGFERTLLLSPILLVTLDSGIIPGSGVVDAAFRMPDMPGDWGNELAFQCLQLDPLANAVRFGNVFHAVIWP